MNRKYKVAEKSQLTYFEVLASYTEDDEWRDMLTNISKGIFPPNFNYINGNLVFKRTGDPKKIKLSNNPEIAIKEFIKFVNNKGIYTTQEHLDKQKISEDKLLKEWSSIKSENMQKFYINDFLDSYKEKSQLSKDESDSIKTEVFLDFIDRKLDKMAVTFQNGHITKLKSYTLASNG